MGTKNEEQDLQKPTFDPSDFLPDEDGDELPENLDFGDSLEVDDDVEPEEAPQEEAEAEAEEEPSEPEEDEPVEGEAPEQDAEAEAPEGEEEAPEAEGEPEERKPGKPNHMIPKRRLDQQIAKTRQMENELKKLQDEVMKARREAAERERVPEEQIQDWLKQAADKAMEGATEESAKLHKQAMDAMAQNRGEPSAQQQQIDPNELVAQIEERVELKHTVKQLFEEYPMLNPDNEQFDETLNTEALEFQDFYLNKGYSMAIAVEKAVQALAATHGLESAKAEPARKPERDTSPNIKKKLDAAKRQPAEPTARRGNKAAPEETVDISQLDEEALLALPESVRARLRGDM